LFKIHRAAQRLIRNLAEKDLFVMRAIVPLTAIGLIAMLASSSAQPDICSTVHLFLAKGSSLHGPLQVTCNGRVLFAVKSDGVVRLP
jgi:hypothetical protein